MFKGREAGERAAKHCTLAFDLFGRTTNEAAISDVLVALTEIHRTQ